MPSLEELQGGLTVGAWRAVQRMPQALTRRAFAAAADRAYRKAGKGTRQLARNYARVLGERATPELLAQTVRAGLQSYARYWWETFHLERMDLDQVSESALANSPGFTEAIAESLDRGKGLVIALPHLGNWDIAGLTVCRTFGSLTTVAERLRPEAMYTRFLDYRQALGMEILPLTGGDKPVFGTLKDRLAANGIVCLLTDRDLGENGIEVDFFGAKAKMPGGPGMLAALTGCDVRVLQLHNLADSWHQEISAPVAIPDGRLRDKVGAITQAVADGFAVHISRFPQDWHMMQKLWLDDLTPRADLPT